MTETETAPAQPQATGDYEMARFNALKHGVLSRYTVLPWENEDEYRAVLNALVEEHKPTGPTEEHLVEELAGILWRKRRLRLAESAACRRGFMKSASVRRKTVMAALAHLDTTQQIERVVDAIRATPRETTDELADIEQDEAVTTRALDLLRAGKAGAYQKALGAVCEDTREWWELMLQPNPSSFSFGEDEKRYTADADSLLEFLVDEVMPWYETRRKELQNRPLICEQAFGDAVDPDRLEGLARYEVHLDRKLERTLTSYCGSRNCATPTSPQKAAKRIEVKTG